MTFKALATDGPLVPPLLPPLYAAPGAPLLPLLGRPAIYRRPPWPSALVARFTELVAEPGTPAHYLDAANRMSGTDGQQAAARSGRAYFVGRTSSSSAARCWRSTAMPARSPRSWTSSQRS